MHAGLYAYSLYAYAAQQQRTYQYALQPPRRTPIIIIIIIIIIRPHSSIVHDMIVRGISTHSSSRGQQ